MVAPHNVDSPQTCQRPFLQPLSCTALNGSLQSCGACMTNHHDENVSHPCLKASMMKLYMCKTALPGWASLLPAGSKARPSGPSNPLSPCISGHRIGCSTSTASYDRLHVRTHCRHADAAGWSCCFCHDDCCQGMIIC